MQYLDVKFANHKMIDANFGYLWSARINFMKLAPNSYNECVLDNLRQTEEFKIKTRL